MAVAVGRSHRQPWPPAKNDGIVLDPHSVRATEAGDVGVDGVSGGLVGVEGGEFEREELFGGGDGMLVGGSGACEGHEIDLELSFGEDLVGVVHLRPVVA